MELSELKSRIQSYSQQGRAIRARIHQSQGLDRYALWNEKREIGHHARILLLAYGYVRGRRYRSIEARTRDGNAPHAGAIFARLVEFGRPADIANLTRWLEEAEPAAEQPSGPEVHA